MTMNDDILNYPVYILTPYGTLMFASWIQSTNDYNHNTHNLHHFIPKGLYKRNKEWFDNHEIRQKLILLPNWLHLIVHNSPAGANLTDDEFKERFHISRWELVFNKRYSEY